MYLVGDGESFKNQDGEQVQIEKKRQNQPQLISCLRLGLSCWLCIRKLFLVVISTTYKGKNLAGKLNLGRTQMFIER
jgi:hypothetical protein